MKQTVNIVKYHYELKIKRIEEKLNEEIKEKQNIKIKYEQGNEENKILKKNYINIKRRPRTCGDSGGITADGYPCERIYFLDISGRCKDH